MGDELDTDPVDVVGLRSVTDPLTYRAPFTGGGVSRLLDKIRGGGGGVRPGPTPDPSHPRGNGGAPPPPGGGGIRGTRKIGVEKNPGGGGKPATITAAD